MGLIIWEIKVKSVLTRSGIPGVDYCINPYQGFIDDIIQRLKKGFAGRPMSIC